MAEPGKETAAAPPPPPQETETTDGSAAATESAPQAPAAVEEPSKETTTPTSLAAETVATGDGALAPEPSLPKAESAPSSQELHDAAVAGQPQQKMTEADGEPPLPTKAGEVVGLPPPPAETPAQQSAAPQKKQGGAPEQATSVHEEVKDAAAQAREKKGEEKPARRRWRRLRAVVRVVFRRFKSAPPPPPGDKSSQAPAEDKKQHAKDGAGGVPAEPEVKEREEGEAKASARRRWRRLRAAVCLLFLRPKIIAPRGGEQSTLPPEDKGGETKAPVSGTGMEEKKPATAEIMPAGGEKGDETKTAPPDGKQPASGPPAEGEKEKPHPKWPREEERLERILEEAFTRLLAAEYKQLGGTRQRCLLTFSVFELASLVKKQAMIYWWVADMGLRLRADTPQSHAAAPQSPPERRRKGKKTIGRLLLRSNRKTAEDSAAEQGRADRDDAEDVFFKLSDDGFLVPIKNWCSKVIHGCQVNPLVHWMVKRQARCDRFADLDAKGSPADSQPNSSILCLTAGNRVVLQQMRIKDESQGGKKAKVTNQASLEKEEEEKEKEKEKDKEKVPTKDESKAGNKSRAIDKAPSKQDPAQVKEDPQEQADQIALFEGKRVILNINAHVYPVPESAFLYFAEFLVVLQLGRWCNLDDNTYMEVDRLESLNGIRLLKNLRYLGLRGLSRLTGLPKGIQSLRKLAILDMRGCQNLVKVEANVIAHLKQLTHLDLTECYMLEHIDQGITYLTELQVFKGFVFATGTQGKKACRLQDLKKLSKLQKLTISVTTDANVHKGEMGEIKNLTKLRKLTITWSEIPSILEDKSEKAKDKRKALVHRWTSFELPEGLVKLDIRCYPCEELTLTVHENLKKLYLRGGGLTKFSFTDESKNYIKTLRLRYLKNFSMKWVDIHCALKDIEHVEIVVKDKKIENDKKQEWNLAPLEIPKYTLDEHGVWTKDKKEEENTSTKDEVDNKIENADQGATEKIKEPVEESSAKAAAPTMSASKKDDDDVRKEQAAEGKEEKVATPEVVPEQQKTDPTSTK